MNDDTLREKPSEAEELMTLLGYELRPAVKDHKNVTRYEDKDGTLQNVSKPLAEKITKVFHQYAQAYAESIIGPDKRIGDEIAKNRSYTGERMHNAVKAEQRTLNNERGGKL